MTSPSFAGHRDHTYSEDEDKVVFRSPTEKSASGLSNTVTPIGAKRSSLGVSPQQAGFPTSVPNGKDANGTGSHGHTPDPGSASQWTFPTKSYGADSDASWEMGNLKLSDDSGMANGKNSVLAPAAEIGDMGQGGPHSRQSSAGGSVDSPAIPTPAQGKSVDSPDADKTFKGQAFAAAQMGLGQNGYPPPYGYDTPDVGFISNHFNAAAGMMNGHVASPTQINLHRGAMSPLMAGLPGQMPMAPFSPHLQPHIPPLSLGADGQTPYSPQGQDFSAGYGAAGRINGRPAAGGRHQQNGAAAAAFPTLNSQPVAAAAYPYGSPPPTHAANPYAAGMMSPTLASPTFVPNAHNPYAGNPYAMYAGSPGPMGNSTSLYELMSPQAQLPPTLSPQSTVGPLPGRHQTQMRGHGYSASNPAALRDVTTSPQRQQGARQGQHHQRPPPPRTGTQPPAMNHAHSLSLPHSATPYSPQLNAAYAPMSPPPFPAFYGMPAHLSQQQQQDLLQAAIAMAHGQNPAADPAVMMLIQQGGGPSANNRKLGLYKTELCRSWEEKGSCKYGEKCQFAHGDVEQRRVERHPKYKTEICRTFWVSGSCPYGKRCCFIHTELPANAPGAQAAGQADDRRTGTTPNGMQNQNERGQQQDGRARSMSTNSDPNDPPSSLLARISARTQAQANHGREGSAGGANRSSDASPANAQLDPAIAEAIARAYTAYGRPGGGAAPQSAHVIETPPEDHVSALPTPQPQPTAGVFSGFSTRNGTTTSGFGGGHHRVSASVDFGRGTRGLGSDLSVGLGHGLGHQRNPSASSVVPPSTAFPGLSRTPLSGQSTPFGENASRGVTVGSSLLDSPW